MENKAKNLKRQNRSKTIEGISASITALAVPLSAFLRKNPKTPSAKSIHKVRTRARKLESALALFPVLENRKLKRLQQNLEDIRKHAGKIRDMDVLTANVLTLKMSKTSKKGKIGKIGKEKRCLVQLLEFLGAERSKRVNKLRGLVEADGRKLRKRLQQGATRFKKLRLRQDENGSKFDGAALAAAEAGTLSSELHNPVRLSRSNLHAFRLKVKTLSDRLENVLPTNPELISTLGKVQKAIGQWHDWDELLKAARLSINGRSDHGKSCKVIQAIRKTDQMKYRRALSAIRDMRTHAPQLANAVLHVIAKNIEEPSKLHS